MTECTVAVCDIFTTIFKHPSCLNIICMHNISKILIVLIHGKYLFVKKNDFSNTERHLKLYPQFWLLTTSEEKKAM